MGNNVKILLFLGITGVFQSCIKDESFDDTPIIKFETFELYSKTGISIDSAKYTFSFTDGDGDLGEDDSTVFNCFLQYEEKDGDGFTMTPTLLREYQLPSLTPNANDKNIEGEISLILKPAPIFSVLTDSAYRYSCYVIDRAGNKSNVISNPWTKK
tara:strand:+ start:3652 stop:4119 length:468 start_codon:yes stop_codon:yes gene_type:complete